MTTTLANAIAGSSIQLLFKLGFLYIAYMSTYFLSLVFVIDCSTGDEVPVTPSSGTKEQHVTAKINYGFIFIFYSSFNIRPSVFLCSEWFTFMCKCVSMCGLLDSQIYIISNPHASCYEHNSFLA